MNAPFEGGIFTVTSIIGNRTDPFGSGAYLPHYGLDIVGISSKNVISVTDGMVVTSQIVTNQSDPTSQWGNYVCVRTPNDSYIYYCHLSRRLVVVGQSVSVGTIIGVEGATGAVTGSHLHLEARHSGIRCRIPVTDDDPSNVAAIIGITNQTGVYTAPDPITFIISACGLSGTLWEPRMREFQSGNQYGYEFWKKVARRCGME